MTGILIAGALVGMGLTLVVAGLRPPAPDLAAGVARLTGTAGSTPALTGQGPVQVGLGRVASWLVDVLDLDRHRADLALTGTTSTRLAMEKLGYAFVGLAFPVLLTAILTISGTALPFVVPVAASLVLAVVLSFMPEVELRRRAAAARVQMRRTVCVYLELVALEVS